jgi:CRISPR-associated endonuclease/helicase Cas3
VLRLDSRLIATWEANVDTQARSLDSILAELRATFDFDAAETARERRSELLMELAQRMTLPEHLREICRVLRGDAKPSAIRLADDGLIALVSRRRVAPTKADLAESDASTSAETTSQGASKDIPLSAHLENVAARARRYAIACGIPDRVAAIVEGAGAFHDFGKADPRFQAWLHGGNVLAARRGEPLAKSGTALRSSRARAIARRAAGYPQGARHEMQSVAMIHEDALADLTDIERELLLHLVASHHGHGRPFAPAFDDPRPVPVHYQREGESFEAASNHQLFQVGSGVADRFWRLTREYGWHGLAWLEAILRLADHRQSEEEQQ